VWSADFHTVAGFLRRLSKSFGRQSGRRFVEECQILGAHPEQWQRDAFGQVDVWLPALGLKA
jgi:hypothetical protein